MPKLYRKLRALMRENDDTTESVARVLLLGRGAVSRRLNGHDAWTLDEAYTLLERYHQPHSALCEVFPKGGVS